MDFILLVTLLGFSLNYEFYILVLYCTQIRLLGKKTRVNVFYDEFITIISDGMKILYNFIQKSFRIYQIRTENSFIVQVYHEKHLNYTK